MADKKVFNNVLIVDDDDTSVFLTQSVIEEMNMAQQILTASNGQEGLEKVKQYCMNQGAVTAQCPNLILLDINMPIMNGFEVVEQLNIMGQSQLVQAKIVVLTSSAHKEDIEKMKSLGIKNYLVKPLTEDKIIPFLGEIN